MLTTVAMHKKRQGNSGQDCLQWISLAPAPGAIHRTDRPRDDRFAAKVAGKVIGQRRGGFVSSLGTFLQALQTDRFKIEINLRVELARRGRLGVADLPESFDRGRSLKRRAAG